MCQCKRNSIRTSRISAATLKFIDYNVAMTFILIIILINIMCQIVNNFKLS